MTENPESEMPVLSEGERNEIMAQEWHQQESAIKDEIANNIRAQLHAEYLTEKEKLRGDLVAQTWLNEKYRKLGLWASYENDPRLQAEAQKRMKEIRPFIVEKTLNSFEQAKEEKRQETLRAEHSKALRELRTLLPEQRAMRYVEIEQSFRSRGLKL